MDEKFDVLVAGGGPAGATVAFCLARAGVKVGLLEKERYPRYKTCGGGLVGRAFQFSPIDLSPAAVRSFYAADLHFLDAKLVFPVQREKPILFMAMRDVLDMHLARAAERAGAKVMEQRPVDALQQEADALTVETSGGSLQAKILVAADGALSPVAKLAGWPETRRLIPALEYEVQVPARIFSSLAARPRFDFGIVPGGYAWVFPKASHLSMGVLTTRRSGVNLESYFRQYLAAVGVDEVRGEVRHGFQIPLSPRKDGFSKGRVFVAGDAAGLADPITAEGISHAILSGRLLAEVLVAANLNPAIAAKAYAAALDSQILPELKIARRLARIVYDFPGLRNFLFKRLGARFSEAITDIVMGEKSYRDCFKSKQALIKLLWRAAGKPIPTT